MRTKKPYTTRITGVRSIVSLRLIRHTLPPKHIVQAAFYGGHSPVAGATLVAGFGGAIVGALIGFATVRVSAWLDERKRQKQFLIGLTRDIERCQTIHLNTTLNGERSQTTGPNSTLDSLQLLNPISFPFIRQIAQGQYMYLLDPAEITALLKIFYLIENFLRYQEPELQMLLDEIRNPGDKQKADQLDALRNRAIAPLEAALQSEAKNAYALLTAHRHSRHKVQGIYRQTQETDGNTSDNRELLLFHVRFRDFHQRLAEKITKNSLSVPDDYCPLWDPLKEDVIFEWDAEHTLTIHNVAADLLEQVREDDVEKMYGIISSWHQSHDGTRTVNFQER